MKRMQCHSAIHESNRECSGEHLGGVKMGKVAPLTLTSVSSKNPPRTSTCYNDERLSLGGESGNVQVVAIVCFSEL
jgi:hypothetical protein